MATAQHRELGIDLYGGVPVVAVQQHPANQTECLYQQLQGHRGLRKTRAARGKTGYDENETTTPARCPGLAWHPPQSLKPMQERRHFVRSFAFGLVLAGAMFAAAPAHAQAAAVPTAVVGSAAAAASFELDGRLEPLRQSTVSAQLGGTVLELRVTAGERVRAGQVLARIDGRDAQATLARNEAAVAQAEVELRNARLQHQRTLGLHAQQFLSQAALDASETRLKAAETAVRQAQTGRTQAALARGFATLTAPFAGIVLATHLEAGELAAAGRPVATLYAPGALRAVVQVPTSRLALARRAQRIELQLPGQADWRAPVAVSELPLADAVSQTVTWRLDLSAADSAAQLPGTALRVRFVAAAAAAPEVLTVPATALLRRGELTAVFLVREGRFVLRAVRVGAPVGEQVPVLAGLAPGERVALDPVRAGLRGATPAP